jgi:hypothetical protein
MRTAFALLGVLLTVTACATSTQNMRADSAGWMTTKQILEYSFVPVSSVKIGDMDVPIFDYEWEQRDLIYRSGTDRNPILPEKPVCSSVEPKNPKIGERYCEVLPTRYYLLFGEGKWQVEVTEGVWNKHNPGKSYKTSENVFGFRIVEDP